MDQNYIKQRIREVHQSLHYRLYKVNQVSKKLAHNGMLEEAEECLEQKFSLIEKILKHKDYIYECYIDPSKPHLYCFNFSLHGHRVGRVHLPDYLFSKIDMDIVISKPKLKWNKK